MSFWFLGAVASAGVGLNVVRLLHRGSFGVIIIKSEVINTQDLQLTHMSKHINILSSFHVIVG